MTAVVSRLHFSRPKVAPLDGLPWELATTSPVSVNAQEAWRVTRGSRAVTVAVIDSDFDLAALSSQAQVRLIRIGSSQPARHKRQAGHGTRVTQLIAGSRCGYPGVAPGCDLLLIELDLECTAADEAAAFDTAFRASAAIVCSAWSSRCESGSKCHPSLPTIISNALDHLSTDSRNGRGAVVFVPVGSGGLDVSADPYTGCPAVTPIAGITREGAHLSAAEYGSRIAFSAPASGPFYSIGGHLCIESGASGAAALIAGVAALTLSANPDLDARQLREALRAAASLPQGEPNTVYRKQGISPWFGSGVPDAALAISAARRAKPRRTALRNALNRSPIAANDCTCARIRETRFQGGEHVFLGYLGALAARNLLANAGGSLENAFFGGRLAEFAPSVVSPTFDPSVATLVRTFLDPSETPYVRNGENRVVQFPYLVGLGGDIYGSPDDLRLTITSQKGKELFQFYRLIGVFNKEIAEIGAEFRADTDLDLWMLGDVLYNNRHAEYTGTIVHKNYSHFGGDNFLFYLSYHFIAVDAARRCKEAQPADRADYFLRALVTEALAEHFLTDMFSGGHMRVPRWYFYSSYPQGLSDLLSRLLHQHEGWLGVVARNAQGHIWIAKGDAGLVNASEVCDLGTPSLEPLSNMSDPLNLSLLFPEIPGAEPLHPQFLAGALLQASLIDVIRNMATGFTAAMSATGSLTQPRGLLGYILSRVPYAVPVSQLGRAELQNTIASRFVNLDPPIDTTRLSMTARLADVDGYFGTYENRVELVIRELGTYFLDAACRLLQPNCSPRLAYGAFHEEFLGPAKARAWAMAQAAHLTGEGSPESNVITPSSFLTRIPKLVGGAIRDTVGGKQRFPQTFANTYPVPDTGAMPAEWVQAVPPELADALLTPIAGSWGIEQ
jgi:hypothetical protein